MRQAMPEVYHEWKRINTNSHRRKEPWPTSMDSSNPSWLASLLIGIRVERLLAIRSPDETGVLERQRPARRVAEKLPRLPRSRKAGLTLPSGNQMQPGRCRATLASGLYHLLEHGAKERLRRHCDLHPDTPGPRHPRHRPGAARPRRARALGRVYRLFPRERLCAELKTRTHPLGLPAAMGPRLPPLPQAARRPQTGDLLRRPQRGAHRN